MTTPPPTTSMVVVHLASGAVIRLHDLVAREVEDLKTNLASVLPLGSAVAVALAGRQYLFLPGSVLAVEVW